MKFPPWLAHVVVDYDGVNTGLVNRLSVKRHYALRSKGINDFYQSIFQELLLRQDGPNIFLRRHRMEASETNAIFDNGGPEKYRTAGAPHHRIVFDVMMTHIYVTSN